MPDILERFPAVMRGLPGDLVARLRPHLQTHKARAGQTLVSPDSRSMDVYWVAQGRVQVAVISPAGHEVILRDQGEGDMFGEMAPIDRQPRSATIIALDDCLLVKVPGQVFCEAVFSSPSSAEWLARRLTARIRDLTDRVFELNALSVPNRLRCELLRLCGEHVEARGSIVIEPFPTQRELALRIGTHREAVTREVRYLADQGIIRTDRRRLTVLDAPALTRLVRMAGAPSAPSA